MLVQLIMSLSSFFELSLLSVLVLFDTFITEGMDGVILFLTSMVFSFLLIGRVTYVLAWWAVIALMMWGGEDQWWIWIYCFLFSLPVAALRLGILYLETKLWK